MNSRKIFYVFVISMFLIIFKSCGTEEGSTVPQDTYTGDTHDIQCTCQDKDKDGYGYCCEKGDDCDDNDVKVHVNCIQCKDEDHDGYGLGKDCLGTDCNDSDVNVHPGAKEICGNGKDDDCKGDGDAKCEKECTDNDYDGYGDGKDCKGKDCNDNDFMINPGMPETCGDGKDNDCKGGDLTCPVNCTDNDKDNYGVGSDCVGIDCDDNDPKINPLATEKCDGKDNDCDEKTDECADASKECDMEVKTCKTKLSYSCVATPDCITGLICYGYKCLKPVGGDCLENKECQSNLCDPSSKVCVGDICEILKCEDKGQECDKTKGKCIECKSTFDCPNYWEGCAGGKCIEFKVLKIYDETKIIDMAHGMVDCYKICQPTGELCFCYFIDTYQILTSALGKDEVVNWICNSATASDFAGSDSDLSIAQDIAGCGFFDLQNLVWKTGIVHNSYEYTDCIFWSPSDIWVDKCANYPEQ